MKVTITNEKDEILCEDATVRKVGLKAQDIISELGISQKRVVIEVALPAGNSLRLGTEVDVKIEIEKRQGVPAIPENAIFQLGDQDCVYIIQDRKAVLRQVETGLEGEDHMEILSGLNVGEQIVLSPDANVKNGTRVKIKQ